MTLQDKHAFITGGGTGIGLAIAQDLAAKGARVTITGRRQEVLDAVSGNGITGMAMDVRDEAQVIDTIARAVEANGPVQICVANAGVAEGRSLHKTDLDFWRDMMATNLDGAFLSIRESLKSMRQTDWGRVIAVSSMAGLRGLPGAACYSASMRLAHPAAMSTAPRPNPSSSCSKKIWIASCPMSKPPSPVFRPSLRPA